MLNVSALREAFFMLASRATSAIFYHGLETEMELNVVRLDERSHCAMRILLNTQDRQANMGDTASRSEDARIEPKKCM